MVARIKSNEFATSICPTKGACPESGTGLLEMVLFIPLGLTLLFLFFDCAARFYQTSVTNDLLRRTLSDAAQNKVLERDISGNEIHQQERLQLFVGDLAEQLSQDLSSTIEKMPGLQTSPYGIRVELIGNRNSRAPGLLASAELGTPLSTSKIQPSSLLRNSEPLSLLARIKAPTKGILPQNPLNDAYFQIDTSWTIGLE